MLPVLSFAIRAQNSVSRSSGFSVLSSKRNRFRQHHEIPVYLRLFLNKHSMSFKDLVFTLSKSLTPVCIRSSAENFRFHAFTRCCNYVENIPK